MNENNKEYKKSIILLGAAFALLAFFSFFPVHNTSDTITEKRAPDLRQYPVLEAKAAMAINLKNGTVLFEKNANEALPLASLTKIISILTLFDFINPDEIVAVSSRALNQTPEIFLRSGMRLRAENLMALAMVESSNGAVRALVEHAAKKNNVEYPYQETWFVSQMSKKTGEYKTASFLFYNTTGLDIAPDIAGGYGSAKDLLYIARTTFDHPLWGLHAKTIIEDEEGNTKILKPTNHIQEHLPQLHGAKTGLTDLAGGNLLVIVEYPIGEPLGVVVLGSSEDGRFADVEMLLAWIKTNKVR